MEDPPPIAFETPKPKKKTTKLFKILSETKKEYSVLFEIAENILNISTEIKDEKSFQNKTYKNKYTLLDIQKVKYFNAYDTIEECLSEIDINTGIIKEEKDQLNIVVPINSKKYPEIIFALPFKEKSESEKINELYKIIQNLNDKINILEKKIEDMSNNTIKIITQEKEPNGIVFDLNVIGKNDIGNIINEKNINKDLIYSKIYFNLKNDNDQDDKIINDLEILFSWFPNLDLKKNEKKITMNFNFPLVENILNIFKYLFGIEEIGNLKIAFKTELTVKDILEIENIDIFYDKLTNCHFILNGLPNNGKTALINLLNFLAYSFTKDKNGESPFNGILIPLIIILSWRELNLPNAKLFFQDLFDKIKANYSDNLIKFYNVFRGMIASFFTLDNSDNNKKEIRENIDYEEFYLAFVFYCFNIGFEIKIKLNGVNELIKKKIIKK